MLVIGLDAASQWDNFGYAIGRVTGSRATIESAGLVGSPGNPGLLISLIGPLLKQNERALVAIDAPLGWPSALGPALADHRAGELLNSPKAESFSRHTDRWIQRNIGKTPLNVGADKIALAGYTALEALSVIRRISGKSIPLVWNSSFDGIGVIEVYPGATLKAMNLPDSGYKKNTPQAGEKKKKIAHGVSAVISGIESRITEQIDVFDACLCIAAGMDFLSGRAMPPDDPARARREGWIWTRISV